MAADRIFFSGGEATIHLPYIEKVVEEARKINPDTKVNFDTNGYLTEKSLNRVLDFTTSITYDLKAYHDEVHRALTGASSDPVLRNAEYIGRYAKEKLWEYRILVIPRINDAASELKENYTKESAHLAGSYAFYKGCHTHPRNCAQCNSNQDCGIKRYIPRIST